VASTSCLDVECGLLIGYIYFHIKYRWESTANVPGLAVASSVLMSLWEGQETTRAWNAAGA